MTYTMQCTDNTPINIMIDDRYLGSVGDVAVSGPDPFFVERWAAQTQPVREPGSMTIEQL